MKKTLLLTLAITSALLFTACAKQSEKWVGFYYPEGQAGPVTAGCDINEFETKNSFDRVVSVEMFEHVRNHRELFKRIHGWLSPGGKLFTHVFCHRSTSYPFEVEGEDDWMSKHFFSGGTMPADELFIRISGQLELENRWRWSGEHYAKTSEDWVTNIDNARSEILKLFSRDLSMAESHRTFHRWRIFFLACSETFGFRNGQEWWVSHYLFKKP